MRKTAIALFFVLVTAGVIANAADLPPPAKDIVLVLNAPDDNSFLYCDSTIVGDMPTNPESAVDTITARSEAPSAMPSTHNEVEVTAGIFNWAAHTATKIA